MKNSEIKCISLKTVHVVFTKSKKLKKFISNRVASNFKFNLSQGLEDTGHEPHHASSLSGASYGAGAWQPSCRDPDRNRPCMHKNLGSSWRIHRHRLQGPFLHRKTRKRSLVSRCWSFPGISAWKKNLVCYILWYEVFFCNPQSINSYDPHPQNSYPESMKNLWFLCQSIPAWVSSTRMPKTS